MIENYLAVLQESLEKKNAILDVIKQASQKQNELLKCEKLDMEQFDELVEEKDGYLRELEKLDEGFETVYHKVKQELQEKKQMYAPQIAKLQQLIGEITEKSVSIQAQESRNRDMVTAYFKNERKSLGQGRRSSKAAFGYYQNLNKATQEASRIVDLKQ